MTLRLWQPNNDSPFMTIVYDMGMCLVHCLINPIRKIRRYRFRLSLSTNLGGLLLGVDLHLPQGSLRQ